MLFRSLDERGVRTPATNITYLLQVHIEFQRARALLAERDVHHVVFLGDSTADALPLRRSVPRQLAQLIAAQTRDREVHVTSLVRPGTGPLDYFMIADVISAARPDLVVIHLNPVAFSDRWSQTANRPELAGWIAPSRLLEALRLPLHEFGLSSDELLLNIGIVRARMVGRWQSLLQSRAQLGIAWAGLRSESWQKFRLRQQVQANQTRLTADGRRFRPETQLSYYGRFLEGLDSHPLLELLGATVRRLRRSGSEVLVYVMPINVGYIYSIGLLDQEALARSLAAIERTVTLAGGDFADFHDLLPDAAFNDPGGHFVADDDHWPHRLLAERLAPYVVERALAGAPKGDDRAPRAGPAPR